MHLVEVNSKAMVNIEMISSIETRGDNLIVRIGGKDFTVENHKQFLSELENSGFLTKSNFGN